MGRSHQQKKQRPGDGLLMDEEGIDRMCAFLNTVKSQQPGSVHELDWVPKQ